MSPRVSQCLPHSYHHIPEQDSNQLTSIAAGSFSDLISLQWLDLVRV